MKKLLYIHQHFNSPNQAGSTRSFEFAKRLIKKEINLTILTGSFSGFDNLQLPKGKYKLEGINIYNLGTKYSSKMSYLRRVFSFIDFSLRSSFYVLTNERYDIVFCTSTPITTAIPGLLAKLFRNANFIFEVRDLWPEMPIAIDAIKGKALIDILYRFENITYRLADYIIALSPGMKKGIIQSFKTYGGNIKKIAIIPNSSDIEFFDIKAKKEFRNLSKNYLERILLIEKKLKSNFFNIGYFGSIGFINDPEFIVNIASASQNFANIHIFGDGKFKEEAILKCKKLNIYNKTIFFHGSFPKTGAVYLMSLMDACLVTFLPIKEMEKNSSNKFFDSLAACKPTIINYGGWHAKLLKKYNAGIYVGRDLEKASKKIEELYLDIKLRKTMTHNAKILRQKFCREDAFERLYNIISAIK